MSFLPIGIIEIAYAFPKNKISMQTHANGDKNVLDMLQTNLGLYEHGIIGEDESVITLAKEALLALMKKTNLQENEIGRLEVASETNPDSSKSIKSHLMSLFKENQNISGVDCVQACYAGTAALLNSIQWVESSFSGGKYAIVVCSDAYFYDDLNSQAFASAGAVAILIGRNPVFEISSEVRNYFYDTNDFCKPKNIHPKTLFNNEIFVSVYENAFKNVYNGVNGDFNVLYTPYPGLVRYICKKYGVDNYEKSFLCSELNGNTYTASLYFSLISLLYSVNVNVGQEIMMFAFGSGVSASLFRLKKVKNGCDNFDLKNAIESRKEVSHEKFTDLLNKFFSNN